MTSRRKKSLVDVVYYSLILLFLLSYGGMASFWKRLLPETQKLFLIGGIAALMVVIALVVVLIQYRKRKRREAWQRAMKNYNRITKSGRVPNFQTARDLSPTGLEEFAAQVYKQMGYTVRHTGHSGDHGIDVFLVNPNGQVEIVQCKQWNKPVGEETVQKLLGSIKHEKAARGYLWAPRGFTAPARNWAKDQPIVLADNEEIGRIVESAYSLNFN